MNILVISASMRAQSQSLKVSKYLQGQIERHGSKATLLDLNEKRLPLYDVGQTEAENKAEILQVLDGADGYVFVSPEWNGMMSHGLVNMLHYVGIEMAHKPVMLTGVTAGRNGIYPLAQMRLVGYKNNHYVISPENLLVQDVASVLNDNEIDEKAADYSVKKRAEYSTKVLIAYAKALQSIHDADVLDLENFPNGV